MESSAQPCSVDIWSDIACPWCYLGIVRFHGALEADPRRDLIHVTYRSFQLDPNAPTTQPLPLAEVLAKKFHTTPQAISGFNERLVQLGNEVGISFHFDTVRAVNTADAHRLIHLASLSGRSHEAKMALFGAYFTEGQSVADHHTLLQIGKSLDLATDSLEQMLDSDQFMAEVRQDQEQAQQIGVTGVPHFLFRSGPKEFAISGAQDQAYFAKVIEAFTSPHPAD